MKALHQGYSIETQVFDATEMATVLDHLEDADLARSKAGARHVLSVPAVRTLASDSRLLDIARRFAGPTPIAFRATFFDKSSDSNWLVPWHQDTALPIKRRVDDPSWGPWSTKSGVLYAHAPSSALERVVALRVHLDDSSASNGPLRVLPGTHELGVLTDAQVEELSQSVAAFDCTAVAGSVVVMRPLLVHASSKAHDGRPRRVLHIEYASTVDLGSGLELAVG